MRTLLLVLALGNAACLRDTQYQCSASATCGTSGLCEATGFCSFPDAECTSGRRYSDAAGELAGQCTSGGSSMQDGSVSDGTTADAATNDATQTASCPNGYVTLAGGQAGHLYRVLTTPANWQAQEAVCQATTLRAHLAVPDDLTELQALDTAASAIQVYWIGVSDSQTENTWRTVLGGLQTFLPWIAGAPDDGAPGEDCVEVIAATHDFNDERCNTQLPAICECAP